MGSYEMSHLHINHWKKNLASIPNKVICSWLCPNSLDTWDSDITMNLNLIGPTLSLICLTLDVHGVSYIDVVSDVVVCTVNWLHYSNYESISSSSSNRH